MNFNNLLESLTSQFGSSVPSILKAVLVLIVGIIIARILKKITLKALKGSSADHKLSTPSFSFAATIGKLVYYLILVFVLMTVLGMMGITDALEPLKNMLNEITGFLPNIFAAGIIGFVGYTLANIIKEAVGMISGGVEKYTAKYGISEDLNITGLLKQFVFIIVFIPILLVALDTLNMTMISDPAKAMLTSLFEAIPNILAAGIIMLVFFVVGKFVVGIVGELLKNLKVDQYAEQMGMGSLAGSSSLSTIITKGLYFFIMFFGLTSAVEKLHFAQLSNILNKIMELSGAIIFGMVILLIGNKISQMASDYFKKSDAPAMASIARFATLGLFLAMSLKYMGIADDIVNLAFGLTLGSVAVTFALAFGLGGREAAGKQMSKFFEKF